MKRKVFFYLTQALVIALLFICAETYVRYTGKQKTYSEKAGQPYRSAYTTDHENWYRRHRPNTEVRSTFPEFSLNYMTNNEGCRDATFFVAKSRFRIIVGGDSFGECLGSSNDNTWEKIAQTNLLDSLRNRVEIWNAAFSGSDPVAEYVFLRDRLSLYHPDLYVMQINASDMGDVKIRGGLERFNSDGTVTFKKPPLMEKLFQYSHLFRMLVTTPFFDRRIVDDAMIPIWEQKSVDHQAAKTIIAAIDSARVFCKKINCKFLVVFHPMNWEVEQDRPSKCQEVMDLCKQKNISFLDVRQEFKKMGITKSNFHELYWPIDGHYNNAGYNKLALAILPTLIREIK